MSTDVLIFFDVIFNLQKNIFMPRINKRIEKQDIPNVSTAELKQVVLDALQEIKGRDIVEMSFGPGVGQPLFDAFMLCSATSTTHAEALCDNVQRRVYERFRMEPYHTEGREQAQWILLDYFNVLVHIFLEEKRHFYDLEGLWRDADICPHTDPSKVQVQP